MSKSKNNLAGLSNYLSQGKSSRKSGMPSLATSAAGSPDLKAVTKKLSAGPNANLRSQSFSSKSLHGIGFGKPSGSLHSSASASSDLGNLLKKTESTGLSSLLSGGGLLGGLSGLGTLGSLLGGLFGGSNSKTVTPLATFALPQASSETYSVGSSADSIGLTGGNQQHSGIYAAPTSHATSATSSPAPSSDRIAQAVKIALLNSSSLNDVINEL